MKKIFKRIALCSVLGVSVQFAQAQVKIGDNPTAINKAAILELESGTKGLLFPRVNLTNTTTWSLATGGTPSAGMVVYNTKTLAGGFTGTTAYPAIQPDGTGLYYWDGAGWVSVKGNASNTILSGNGAPSNATGKDGDFYFDPSTGIIYGPKAGGVWPAGVNLKGTDGKTVLNGIGNPTASIGKDGDFYIDPSTAIIYGPKANGVWPAGLSMVGPAGATGVDGRSLLNGTGAPNAATGKTGDFYIDTSTNTIYGPKSGGSWPAGISLKGADGKSTLNGTGAPSAGTGKDGDFYIDPTTNMIYGPKAGGVWPAGVSLVGATGAKGADGKSAFDVWKSIPGNETKTMADYLAAITGPAGADGKTVLSGTGAPSAGTGKDGDFYIDPTTNMIYGPKAGGAWPAGVSLVGATGANGADGKSAFDVWKSIPGNETKTMADYLAAITGPAGADGKTVLSGTGAPSAGTGKDGDFYIDPTTNMIYGPKAGGAWPAGVSLVGAAGQGGVTQAGTDIALTGTGTSADPYIINNKITADNGLTKTASNIQLGGSLTQATTITTDATKTLALAGLQTGANTDKVVVADVNGVLKLADVDLRLVGNRNHITQDAGQSANGSGLNGIANIAIGSHALSSPSYNAFFNTAVGDFAGSALTTGASNSIFGKNALLSATTGSLNTALGMQAMYLNVAGSNNTAAGYSAIGSMTGGDGNTSLGSSAGNLLDNGNNNTFLGLLSGFNLTSGNGNVFLGASSGYPSATSVSNQLLISNINNGNDALIRGDFASKELTINNNLTVTGLNSTAAATTGNRPVVVDANGKLMVGAAGQGGVTQAGTDIALTGTGTSADPYIINNKITADNGLTKTASNIQLGGALTQATTITTDATKTLALAGLQTGANTDNVVVADANGVLKSVARSSFDGDLRLVGNGNHITQDAGQSANGSGLNGLFNIAIGSNAISSASFRGSNNTVIGPDAGSELVNAFSNSAFGRSALRSTTSGSENTAVGTSAMELNITGVNNTAVGYQSSFQMTTGNGNTSLGTYAGASLDNGDYNTFLGRLSGHNLTSGNGNVFLGASSGYQGPTSVSNQLLISNTNNGNDALIRGDFASKELTINNNLTVTGLNSTATATTGNRPVVVDANGKLMVGAATNTAWSLTGNTSTNPSSNFIGTTDAQPLAFRTNNVEHIRLTSAGNLGLGTLTPNAKLEIVAGTANTSGLRLTNLTNAINTATANAAALGVNANGDVVVLSTAPAVAAKNIINMPSVAIDISTAGTFTIDLYTQYKNQYNTPMVVSTGAPAAIPTLAAATDFYYYVTYFDSTIFSNLSIDANGVLTYTVNTAAANEATFMNIVLVPKN